MTAFRPHYSIHLGDVYFVGDASEVDENFLGIKNRANDYAPCCWPKGHKGSFALNGNHEMYARGIAYWHERHRFCGVCGQPTASDEGGHVRRCTSASCGASHFPRTDPAVIMLVHDGERCLLGRKPEWPKGMHSTLAGFVQFGKPIWLTEFCCDNTNSVSDQQAYMEAAIPYLESNPHVYRYSWFNATAIPNAQLTNSDGSLTSLGQTYVSLPQACQP